jgi:2-isopropylmalate synthase
MKPEVEIYDTTLRDGSQGEGINFSVMDKLRIADKLDAFGIHYIEGGWPGSNPKDIEFFEPGAASSSTPGWPSAPLAARHSVPRAIRSASLGPHPGHHLRERLLRQEVLRTTPDKTWP